MPEWYKKGIVNEGDINLRGHIIQAIKKTHAQGHIEKHKNECRSFNATSCRYWRTW